MAKFVGDAVMAIFGAPVSHEDDPERAVRAALAIREELAADGDLEVHVGITTGEALITLDARIEKGEHTASGDSVNTAARLESAHRPAASSSTRRPAGRPSGRSSSWTRLPSWPRASATRSACGTRFDPAHRCPAGEPATHRSWVGSGSSRCSEGHSTGSSASASRSSSPSSGSPGSARCGWSRSSPARPRKCTSFTGNVDQSGLRAVVGDSARVLKEILQPYDAAFDPALFVDQAQPRDADLRSKAAAAAQFRFRQVGRNQPARFNALLDGLRASDRPTLRFLWRSGDGRRQLQLYVVDRSGGQPRLQPVNLSVE